MRALLAFVLLTSLVGADKSVVELSTETFKTHIQSNKFVLVEFFAPWCGHCKALAPQFESAAQSLKDNTQSISIASVDATKHESLADEMGVEGFPTMILFVDGQRRGTYNGDRSAKGIETYMLKIASGEITPEDAEHPPKGFDEDGDGDDDGSEGMDEGEGSHVVSLDDDTFEPFVSSHYLVLVEFYAPWCGHCRALKPEFTEASKILHDLYGEADPEQQKNIPKLAKVDATKHTALAKTFELEGFPTMVLFRNGERAGLYNDERQASSIVNFMKLQSGPGILEFSAVAQLTALQTDFPDTPVVLAIYEHDSLDTDTTKDTDPAFEVFKKSSATFRGVFLFVFVRGDESKRKEFGVTEQGIFVISKDIEQEGNRVQFKLKEGSQGEADELHGFVFRAALPVFGEMGPKSFSKYASAKSSMLLVFVMSKDENDEGFRLVSQVAQELRDNYGLVAAYVDGNMFAEFESELGIKEGELKLALLDYTNERNYAFGQREHTTEAIKAFARDFATETLKPSQRSAEAPANNEQNVVKVVVGRTFAELVSQSGKDVLIEFYAPWCAHCKNFAAAYEKVGEYLAQTSEVVVAKMDISENDPPAGEDFKFATIPSLFLSLSTGKVIPFQGARNIEGVIDFVHKHTTKPFPKPSISTKDRLLNERFQTPDNANIFGNLAASEEDKLIGTQEELEALFDEQRFHEDL